MYKKPLPLQGGRGFLMRGQDSVQPYIRENRGRGTGGRGAGRGNAHPPFFPGETLVENSLNKPRPGEVDSASTVTRCHH